MRCVTAGAAKNDKSGWRCPPLHPATYGPLVAKISERVYKRKNQYFSCFFPMSVSLYKIYKKIYKMIATWRRRLWNIRTSNGFETKRKCVTHLSRRRGSCWHWNSSFPKKINVLLHFRFKKKRITLSLKKKFALLFYSNLGIKKVCLSENASCWCYQGEYWQSTEELTPPTTSFGAPFGFCVPRGGIGVVVGGCILVCMFSGSSRASFLLCVYCHPKLLPLHGVCKLLFRNNTGPAAAAGFRCFIFSEMPH